MDRRRVEDKGGGGRENMWKRWRERWGSRRRKKSKDGELACERKTERSPFLTEILHYCHNEGPKISRHHCLSRMNQAASAGCHASVPFHTAHIVRLQYSTPIRFWGTSFFVTFNPLHVSDCFRYWLVDLEIPINDTKYNQQIHLKYFCELLLESILLK